MNNNTLTLSIFLFASSIHDARSAIIARMEENGDGVVASYSGSIDLGGLQLYSTNPVPSLGYQNVQADYGRFGIGESTSFLRYRGLLGPQAIGSDSLPFRSTSVTGAFTGVWGTMGHIWVPVGYISGSPISGTSSWSGQTLASMGLSVGEYTWTWGSGTSSDKFTLSVVPEPSTAPLVGLGFMCLIAYRHRYNRT